MAHWLVKSEPDECGIDDFAARPDGTIPWDGVRNYQARNFLAKMAPGDEVFLYHSSCKRIGVAGIIRVMRAAYPDPLQFDPESSYYDPKSPPDKPRWQAVDMQFVEKFDDVVPLQTLKAQPELSDLPLVRRGARLSVMPVSDGEWRHILSLVNGRNIG
ncbi:EVE domain-containing protein [Marinobacter sp. R17]|uniref:EVE domain-containing protein n=1 Tax=Marinobacter sp. R17 TaxID=2484250 RepID=UPI000F4D232D|nr:EVE domain-containing protein [Marinobacter sp. R17]ROT97626.1 EVE domain-containing protein [Marinobacter sp. R17]